MATWYSASTPEEQQRLLAAWADAPISNAELCGFLLDTAREQVESYAPEDTPTVYNPVTIEWPGGSTLSLARDGDVVTGQLVGLAGHGTVKLPIPDGYAPADGTMMFGFGFGVLYLYSRSTYSDFPGQVHIAGNAADRNVPVVYLAEPADGDGIPSRYALAQLQQARNLWNAGRTTGDGEVGADGFVFRPYPLDKTIKQMIRPIDGYSNVL